MGRGLSEFQRRVLLWADEHDRGGFCEFTGERDGATWITNARRYGEFGRNMIAEELNLWGMYSASVSRTLRRLEARGLIVRAPRWNRRKTGQIFVTSEGRGPAAAIRAARAPGVPSERSAGDQAPFPGADAGGP